MPQQKRVSITCKQVVPCMNASNKIDFYNKLAVIANDIYKT